jgi:hypothetical protein
MLIIIKLIRQICQNISHFSAQIRTVVCPTFFPTASQTCCLGQRVQQMKSRLIMFDFVSITLVQTSIAPFLMYNCCCFCHQSIINLPPQTMRVLSLFIKHFFTFDGQTIKGLVTVGAISTDLRQMESQTRSLPSSLAEWRHDAPMSDTKWAFRRHEHRNDKLIYWLCLTSHIYFAIWWLQIALS